jgi:hypothetical protein
VRVVFRYVRARARVLYASSLSWRRLARVRYMDSVLSFEL